MRALAALFACMSLALVIGCARSTSSDNPLCTCDDTEKFDGTSCVAAADFTAPTAECTDDGQPVCGCDDSNYTSSCAAKAVGVQVQYGGACNTGTGGNNNGGGFGW